MTNYVVHTALSDDENEGRIWIRDLGLQPDIQNKRRVIRVKNANVHPAKSVWVEALYADRLYLKRWEGIATFGPKEPHIFISGWYRNLLAIEGATGTIDGAVELDIKPMIARNVFALRNNLAFIWALLYRYPRNHPQVLVLATSMLGIIAFGLGFIGIGLGIIGIKDSLPALPVYISTLYIANILPWIGFIFFCVGGIAIAVIGLRGIVRS